jgi:hypothetical protein
MNALNLAGWESRGCMGSETDHFLRRVHKASDRGPLRHKPFEEPNGLEELKTPWLFLKLVRNRCVTFRSSTGNYNRIR